MKNYFNNTKMCLKDVGTLFMDFCQAFENHSLEYLEELNRKKLPLMVRFFLFLVWCVLHMPIVWILTLRILFELAISIVKDVLTVITTINAYLKKPMVASLYLSDWQVGDIIYDILYNSFEELEIVQPKMKENIFPVSESCIQGFGSSCYYRFLIKPWKDSTLNMLEMQKLINLKLEQYLTYHYSTNYILFDDAYILQCFNVAKNGMTSEYLHIDILQIDSNDKYDFISSLNQQNRKQIFEAEDLDLFDKDF